MFCRKCGQTIKDGEKFCHSCGTPVEVAPKKAFDPASAFMSAGSFGFAGDLDDSSNSVRPVVPSTPTDTPKAYTKSTPGFRPANDLLGGSDEPVSTVAKNKTGSTSSVIKKVKKDAVRSDLVQIKRSPRIMHEVPTGVIEIESPPAAGTKPEINWLSTFLPTIVTLGIAIVMSIFFSPMMLIYSLPMTIVGVIVSITNYRKQTRKYTEQMEIRQRKFDEHITSVVKEIERKQAEQTTALLLSDPSTEECFEIVKSRKPRLWERTPEDQDFISVRIGQGPVEFSVKINIPKETLSLEDDVLRARPREIQQKYSKIDSAPIVCNIFKEQICGVVGAKKDTTALIKNLIIQLATHHSYTELKTICIYNPSDDAELRWIKDLPHSCSSNRESSFVATTKDGAKELFRQLSDIFKQRKLTGIVFIHTAVCFINCFCCFFEHLKHILSCGNILFGIFSRVDFCYCCLISIL